MRPIWPLGALLAILCVASTTWARVAMPPAGSPALLTCTGLSGTGASTCALLSTLDPASTWPAGVHVNLFAGTADRASGAVATAAGPHAGAFAAAVAQQLGIYVLRPPQFPQAGLENAQFVWLWNQAAGNPATVPALTATTPRAGWTVLGTSASTAAMNQAQALANAGYLVLAAQAQPFADQTCQSTYATYVAGLTPNSASKVLTYTPPAALCPGGSATGTGQVSIVRPNASYTSSGLVPIYGPVLSQAGSLNATGVTTLQGFGAGAHLGGQIYFFVYGGPPPAYQAAYAGLYATAATRGSQTVAIQRSQQGMIALAAFAVDQQGLPVWYYGEGTLTAAGSWQTTPAAASVPAGSYDAPFLFKPFFQPATSGTNYVDPDGSPMPFANVGSFNLSYAPFDNSAVTATVSAVDSGTLAGPAGTIAVNGAASATLSAQALTRLNNSWGLAQNGSASVQVANSLAPAAGWWWAVYNQTAWNQGSSGFVPLGLFIDPQGSSINAIAVGAQQTPAPSGSTAAPYRPYWWAYSGALQANGQVDGAFVTCTQTNGASTCAPGAAASLQPNANGTLSVSFGGQQITFSRYGTTTSQPQTLAVPLFDEAANGGPWGYMGIVSIGSGSPQILTFDLGSSGLYIDQRALPTDGSVTYNTAVTINQTYDSGVVYNAVLAYGNFTFGGVTAIGLPFAAVTGCSGQGYSACGNAFVGRVGTMGVIQKGGATNQGATSGGVVSSPLYQLPAPFGAGYVLSISNLAVTLGLPTTGTTGFNTVQMNAGTALSPCYPGPNGCPPSWDNGTVSSTISFPDLPAVTPQTVPALFDSGAGTLRIGVLPNQISLLSSVLQPNGTKVVAGTRVLVNMAPLFTNWLMTVGSQEWVNAASVVPLGNGPGLYTSDNLGSVSLQFFDVLWNGQIGLLGARPVQ